MSVRTIRRPWTQEQVDALNHWQGLGYVHEFTCANDHEGDRALLATRDGWVCRTCGYTQSWAWADMLDVPPRPLL